MKCVTKWGKAIISEKWDKVISWQITKIDVAKDIVCYVYFMLYMRKTMQFLDRVMHGESIGEKTNSLAHLVYVVTSVWSFIDFYVNFALISYTVSWQFTLNNE
jgi:hypothetical protein